MAPLWRAASLALLAAGAAEVGVGLTNRINLVSLLLGLLALAAGAHALRAGRYRWPAWVMGAMGAAIAFRPLVYQAPLAARVLVTLSSALFLAALGLALAARRRDEGPARPPLVV